MSEQDQDIDVDRALGAWTPIEPPADFVDRVLAARVPMAPARSRRAWLVAAPIAAAAMIAIVLFAFVKSSKMAESPTVSSDNIAITQSNGANATEPAMGSGSANNGMMSGSAGVAMNQPVTADAGVAVITQPSADDAPTDIAIPAGTSATVHDPAAITALHIEFGSRCPTGATVTILHIGATGPAATSTGHTRAVFTIVEGTWSYEVRCESDPNTLAAQGTIRVVREAANRALPKKQAAIPIDADGRTWRVSYQTDVPDIRVNAPGATFVHYLAGKTETDVPVVNGVAKLSLAEGTYTYWTITPTGRGAKTSTLIVDFDDTAPLIYLGNLKSSSTGGVRVSGTTLSGWKLQINGTPIDVDRRLRFSANVGFGRVVIRAENPQRGVHFYLTLPISK